MKKIMKTIMKPMVKAVVHTMMQVMINTAKMTDSRIMQGYTGVRKCDEYTGILWRSMPLGRYEDHFISALLALFILDYCGGGDCAVNGTMEGIEKK